MRYPASAKACAAGARWRRRARLRPRRTAPQRDRTAASDRRWRRPSLRMESAATNRTAANARVVRSSSRLTPEKPLHSDARRVAITARVCAGVKYSPKPAAVIGIEMVRQLGDQLRRDRHRAGIAVAGGHAIDRALFAQQAVEKVGAARNSGAEFRRIGQYSRGPTPPRYRQCLRCSAVHGRIESYARLRSLSQRDASAVSIVGKCQKS